MTPEDKIVEAIERGTVAVTAMLLRVVYILVIVVLMLSVLVVLKAAPLLPPLEQPPLFDIGDPPMPPANSHVQYWYTMDVPTEAGVLPVEVFATRLYSPVASVGPVDVDVPEPGTWIGVATAVIGFSVHLWLRRRRKRKLSAVAGQMHHYQWALETIAHGYHEDPAVFAERALRAMSESRRKIAREVLEDDLL